MLFRYSRNAAKETVKTPSKKKNAPKKVSKGNSFSYKDKYELEHIEHNILEAEAQVAKLTEKIQEPAVISDSVLMTDICLQLEKSELKVQELYSRWEILEDKKAAAEK